MNTTYLTKDQVPAHLRGAYSGNKFEAVVTASVVIPVDAGLWGGGSRETFSIIHLESGIDATVPGQDSFADHTRKERTVPLVPGIAVIRQSVFQGKDMGLRFYVHPDNAAKFLPAPAAELSDHEREVLSATRNYKSSYGGKDRYEMAKLDHRGQLFPTREAWNTAKASLIAKGLLNKAGAITVAGKNAR